MAIRKLETDSSALESAHYDESAQALDVVFKGGAHYRYQSVTPTDFAKLEQASSHGAHINKFIKPMFVAKRL
jgi:hypothetical protein